jgi:hypothetical protein
MRPFTRHIVRMRAPQRTPPHGGQDDPVIDIGVGLLLLYLLI